MRITVFFSWKIHDRNKPSGHIELTVGLIGVRGFHAHESQKVPVRAIVEADFFLLSSFFLSSSSHPESCLKIKTFARISDVSGVRKVRNEKKKRKKKKRKNEEKMKEMKN